MPVLAVMTGIVRYVKAPKVRRVLKEADGLGTEGTRASTIEVLFTRWFLQLQGKRIRSAWKGLITSLPSIATTDDMTG